MTHMVYLLPFLIYLAGSESVFVRLYARPSDPDTIRNTALEVIALHWAPINGRMNLLERHKPKKRLKEVRENHDTEFGFLIP